MPGGVGGGGAARLPPIPIPVGDYQGTGGSLGPRGRYSGKADIGLITVSAGAVENDPFRNPDDLEVMRLGAYEVQVPRAPADMKPPSTGITVPVT